MCCQAPVEHQHAQQQQQQVQEQQHVPFQVVGSPHLPSPTELNALVAANSSPSKPSEALWPCKSQVGFF